MLRPAKTERLKYHVDYPQDTEFSAYARLLQSKWRDRKGYPELKMGNFLDLEFAKSMKANFLTENIRNLVVQEIKKAKGNRGLIGEPRIWNNLLSSQPLCFNLFGELFYDLDLATRYFKKIFPGKLDNITEIKFEYSPGRGDLKYTGDHSAFDVFVEFEKEERKGFIGIEVKYAESLKEETRDKAKKNYRERYAELSKESGLFKADSIKYLKQPPLSQIWRDHLLSIVIKKEYNYGFFVFLFPSGNVQCQHGVDDYKQHLIDLSEERSGFYVRYLEDAINTMAEVHNADWVKELKERYLGN